VLRSSKKLDKYSTTGRNSRLNASRSSPSPAAIGRRVRPDKPFHVFLATALYWLVVARAIIPGVFDYDPNLNVVEITEKYALLSLLTWLTFLSLPCLLIASRIALLLRLLRFTNRFFLALIAFATLSVVWSIDTHATLSKLSHVWAVILICLAVILVRWNISRVQQVTRPILTLLLIGSLVFGLIAPDLAITPPIPPDTKYYWHGLAGQKNQLGGVASLGAIFWFHGWASREVKWLPALCGWLISMLCLVLSRSSTSLMATTFASVLLLMMLRPSPLMRRYMPYAVGVFVVITLAYTLAVLKIVPALELLLKPITALSGKDSSFSGRTLIWDLVREHMQHAPILGTGYGAYWSGPVPSSPSYIFLRVLYYYPNEGHNGYLDTINDLGYVGLLLLLCFIATYMIQSLRLWRINRTQGALYIALIFQQLFANLSETHWLFIGTDFIVLTLATVAIGRSLMEASPAQVSQRNLRSRTVRSPS
jgi:exopolysaccharide production protein ExoQ